jgi:hypothetical protein
MKVVIDATPSNSNRLLRCPRRMSSNKGVKQMTSRKKMGGAEG